MARKSTKKAPAKPVCPVCKEPMVRIVYGYPSMELFESSARGEVALGGCVVSGFGVDPTHRCRQGHEWCWDGEWTPPGAVWDALFAEIAGRLESESGDDGEDPLN